MGLLGCHAPPPVSTGTSPVIWHAEKPKQSAGTLEKKVMLGREEVVGVATGRQVSHVTDQRERSGVEKIGKAGGYWIV